jgi:hypothetical protein
LERNKWKVGEKHRVIPNHIHSNLTHSHVKLLKWSRAASNDMHKLMTTNNNIHSPYLYLYDTSYMSVISHVSLNKKHIKRNLREMNSKKLPPPRKSVLKHQTKMIIEKRQMVIWFVSFVQNSWVSSSIREMRWENMWSVCK